MKLYIYEHCPFCMRAQLAAGLKNISCETEVVLEGDFETPEKLIGKKMFPILEKQDGTHMGESLDIVRYLDQLGEPVFEGEGNEAINQWLQDNWNTICNLIIPRFTQGQFAELATPHARQFYRLIEEKAFGNLEALLADSEQYIEQLQPQLEALAPLIKSHNSVDMTDIKLWPILRSLTIVKGLAFPAEVKSYVENISEKSKVNLLFNQAA